MIIGCRVVRHIFRENVVRLGRENDKKLLPLGCLLNGRWGGSGVTVLRGFVIK